MSSTALVVLALVVAVLSVPTVGGLTAWGLAGGDGEAQNIVFGILGMLVGFGSLYNALTTYLALFGISPWQWWLTLAAPIAGLVGITLSLPEFFRSEQQGWRDAVLGYTMQLALFLPALLLWWSDAV